MLPGSSSATHASGVSARKTFEDVRRQHFHHAVQDERHEYELVNYTEHRYRKIQRLGNEKRQASQRRQQPPRAFLVPDGKP
jgi:hypothetical protein